MKIQCLNQMAIEEEFDIEIPDQVAERTTIVKQALDYIIAKATS